MRRVLPVLGLLALTGCGTQLDPTFVLREAAQRLRFTLDRVQPGLEVRLPLDRSSLRLDVTLGMDNPTDVRLQVRGIRGTVWLDQGGRSHRIGEISSRGALVAEPRGRGIAPMTIQLTYGDIKAAWEPLSQVVLRHGAGTWRVEGTASLDLLGVPLEVPFRTSRESGR